MAAAAAAAVPVAALAAGETGRSELSGFSTAAKKATVLTRQRLSRRKTEKNHAGVRDV
jgi:hypothetical protein